MFKRDPEKAAVAAAQREERQKEREVATAKRREEAAVRREERTQARAAAAAKAQEAKVGLSSFRASHPAEKTLNAAASLQSWPQSKRGETRYGPIGGGHAEFIDAGAHKGWTATRLVAGAATLGASAAMTGRKNKGVAVINLTFGNGAAQTYNVKPDKAVMRAANQYVTAFNALAGQIDREGGA